MGIIRYLKNNSNRINDFINITVSSNNNEGSEQYHPKSVLLFDDINKWFVSKNIKNSWICFDFKDHRVIPDSYLIRSANNNLIVLTQEIG